MSSTKTVLEGLSTTEQSANVNQAADVLLPLPVVMPPPLRLERQLTGSKFFHVIEQVDIGELTPDEGVDKLLSYYKQPKPIRMAHPGG